MDSSDQYPYLPRLKQVPFERQLYQIWTPARCNPAWSILLPYLIPEDGDSTCLRKRIRKVLGRNKDIQEMVHQKIIKTIPNSEEIAKCISLFNPFTNSTSLYKRECMKEVPRILHFRLVSVARQIKTDHETSLTVYLKVASKMLNCILVVHTENPLKPTSYYPLSPGEKNQSTDIKRIVLFKETIHKACVFSFGVGPQQFDPWRKNTLCNLLKIIKLPEDGISRVRDKIGEKKDLLICLLTDPHDKDIIYALYRSPIVLRWLIQIGYDVDPTCSGREGYSSFHYCKQYADARFLRVLYYNALNKLLLPEKFDGEPISMLQLGLRRIREVNNKDYSKSNNLSSLKESYRVVALKTGEQIIRFNVYQQTLVSDIRVKHADKDYEEREKIMVIILKHYCEYFYYDMSNKTEFERYQTYTKFEEYHELADGFTYLLFSHNLLSLKWEKGLGKGYKDMVLSLYLTLLGNKLLLKYKIPQGRDNVPDADECPLRFVMFCTRKDFRENARQMIKNLRRASIGNKFNSPSTELSSSFGLNDIQPEIVDEFRVKRLILYIQEAINMSLDNQPQKGALVIERTLQIIGESMEQTIGSNSLLLSMLVSCISPALVNELQNISNQYLSYNRTYSVQSRIDIANNVEHFKKIQYELKTLYDIIIPISISLTYRVEELLIKKGSDEFQRKGNETFRSKLLKQMEGTYESMADFRRSHFLENKWNFKNFSRKMLFNFESTLKSKTTLKGSDLKQFTTVKFLINFVIEHCESTTEDMTKALQNLDNVLNETDVLNDSSKNKLAVAFSACWTVLDGIFLSTQEEKHPYFEFPEISSLFKNSKTYDWFSSKETALILKKVKKQSQQSSNSKNAWKKGSGEKHKSSKSVEEKSTKTNEDIGIFSLQQCFEQHREALMEIQLPETLELKVSSLLNQKLVFLIDRIRHLKEIFDEDEFKAKSWWTQKETERENVIYFMARRFYEEMDTRVAVEMLFYDCSRILKRQDLEDLWIKINCLFTGLNMRDIIPQGNPALEAVGVLLGQQDMPSELMQKYLELVDDLDALEALFNMWETLKPIREEEFIDTIDNTTDSTLITLAKQITNCEQWKGYLRLLSFS